MKQTVTESMFRDGCREFDCGFSYHGAETLYDYLTELEEGVGKELEFDPIAIAQDFVEYEDLAGFQRDYNDGYKSLDDIEEDYTVIPIDDESFIIGL